MKYFAVALLVASCGLLAHSADTTFFTKESQVVDAAQKKIHTIEQEFETGVRTKNAASLTKVLGEIKKEQAAVKEIRAAIEVHTESEHFDVSFFERIMLECLHIRTGIMLETLKTIAQEILGQQNGISDFPVYQYSAKLESAKVLLTNKFLTLLTTTKSTDTILATAAKKNVKLTAEEKATVNKSLGELVKTATAIHDELARDYHSELELLHQGGKNLRLMQKMDIESIIDEVSFVQQFLKQFHELFQRIDDPVPM